MTTIIVEPDNAGTLGDCNAKRLVPVATITESVQVGDVVEVVNGRKQKFALTVVNRIWSKDGLHVLLSTHPGRYRR